MRPESDSFDKGCAPRAKVRRGGSASSLRGAATSWVLDTVVSGQGLEHLAKLSKLTTLVLWNTRATAADARKLQEALPECRILAMGYEPRAD